MVNFLGFPKNLLLVRHVYHPNVGFVKNTDPPPRADPWYFGYTLKRFFENQGKDRQISGFF